MTPTSASLKEQERLAALKSYNILDTTHERDFDELTQLASAVCETPISLISFIDNKREWFKSNVGIDLSEVDKQLSFCSHVIGSPKDIVIIEDARKDECFANNSLVTGETNFRFYAGVPLCTIDGLVLGALCVIDHKVRQLSEKQIDALKIIARQVIDKLELRKRNADLEAANQKLFKSQQEIQALNEILKKSESRIHSLIEQFPVATIVFRGEHLCIDTVNAQMLELLNKDADIVGKPLLEAMPELKGQPACEMLYEVYRTGNPVHGYDTPVALKRGGKIETGYFNFSYVPLWEDNNIVGIIDMTIEVTQQVIARLQTAHANELLNQAIISANMGTWYSNLNSEEFTASARLKEIFGYGPNEEMPYQAIIKQIVGDYRESVLKEIRTSMAKGERYVVEYPIIKADDKQLRWLRITGDVFKSNDGKRLFSSGTVMDITEQKQDEQRKNDFIGMVSHELKTPLTSLSGYLQVLHSKAIKAGDTFSIQALDKTIRQVKKMMTMINGFLNVSRLESSQIYIEYQWFDMAALVKEVEDEFMTTITTHKVLFAPGEYTLVNADRDKIGHVINNFISNAVKYSPPGSTIKVACINEHDYVKVSVQDEGIGIKPKDKERIFDRFYRVSNESTQSIAGFGIGLYLCTEIVRGHGGRIGVESEFGKGSTFWFTIPFNKPDAV